MKFEAIMFDLFGTLVDDFVSSVGQMNTELATALGAPLEPFMELWRETAEMRSAGAFQTVEASIEHVCAIMGVRVGTEEMNKAVQIRLHYTRRALEPRPNALMTLTQLKTLSYKIGLLSNCSIEIPILWPKTPFAHLFDTAIFSSRERLKKPDPRIYHLACERLGVTPDSCLYVADGENYELAAAGKVGLHSVLIRTGSVRTNSRLHQEATEWRGPSIATLPEVLQIVSSRLRD
jgi:putative hydrolase of the HAD superfamily